MVPGDGEWTHHGSNAGFNAATRETGKQKESYAAVQKGRDVAGTKCVGRLNYGDFTEMTQTIYTDDGASWTEHGQHASHLALLPNEKQGFCSNLQAQVPF